MKINTKNLGTFFILISATLFAHIYYPVVIQELTFRTGFTTATAQPKSTQFGLIIDKIGVNEKVIYNVNPFNQTEYLTALSKGLAHARNTATPDQSGTVYIFGHSSDNPFSITKYNTSFLLLNKLKAGDRITLYYQDNPYLYSVTKSEVVSPYNIKHLTDSSQNQLILQTCTPVGTSINRLLVFAKPISS